ncbi:MAG: hypothetical protein WA152_01725 [Microgenomates group bacterium]
MKERNDTLEASQEFKLFIKNLFAPIKKEARNHRLKSEFHTPEDLKLSPSRLERMYKDLSQDDIKNFLQKHSASASKEAVELLDALLWIKSKNNQKQNGVVNCGNEGLRLYKNRQVSNVTIQFDADPKNSTLTVIDESDAMLVFDNQPTPNGRKVLKEGYITTKDDQRLLISTHKGSTDIMSGTEHTINLTDRQGNNVAKWSGRFHEGDSREEVLWQENLAGIISPNKKFTLQYFSQDFHTDHITVFRTSDPLMKRGEINPHYGAIDGEADLFAYLHGSEIIAVRARINHNAIGRDISKTVTITEHLNVLTTQKDILITKAKIRAHVREDDPKNIDAVINSVVEPLQKSIDSR